MAKRNHNPSKIITLDFYSRVAHIKTRFDEYEKKFSHISCGKDGMFDVEEIELDDGTILRPKLENYFVKLNF